MTAPLSWGAAVALVVGLSVAAAVVFGRRGVRRTLAHAWTVTLLVLSSPLFIEPLLRIFPG